MKYEAYKPTKWEKRIDHAVGLLSTSLALKRMANREQMNWFRYLSAQPTSSRPNSPLTTAGEWLRIQREKMQVMWNAIDMVDNSGLCSGILQKFPTYICGTLRWQARTGDKNVNTQYQQYIQFKTGKPTNIDITGRASLRQQCMLDVKSIMLKGDVGTNIIRDSDDELYLQGIEANRIGDPYKWQTSDTYVRGLTLDPNSGRILSVRVYYQDRRSGTYRFDAEYPTLDDHGFPKFLFFTNPISYDDYRGVSLFKHAIDNSTYIDRMRQYELQALLWAASQSGVYYTKSGALPAQLPFSAQPIIDKDGNQLETFETHPNTLVALSSEGERVEMFQHDRPSPNVIGMYENTINDISIGAGVTKQFTWGMSGTGPEVRMASAQDARAIQIWQEMLRESKLDNVIMLLLGDAIAKKEVPYHPNWLTWDWFFPATPTIDVGRESQANIEEINSVVNTGANVVAEAGLGDIEDVIVQRGHEIGMMIDAAQDEAKERGLQWEQVYALMIPPPKGAGQGGGMPGAAKIAADKVAAQNPDKAGATDDGADIDGENGSNGKQNLDRSRPLVIQNFYDPGQSRDASGKFTDEGKGSQEPGYVHPGDYAGGGKATEEIPGPAKAEERAAREKQADIGAISGKATEEIPAAARAQQPKPPPEAKGPVAAASDEGIDKLYNPKDAETYKTLKAQWSDVNNQLLKQIDTPDSPEARAGVKKLYAIVRQMHELHADPGGAKGIGEPGGPKDILIVGAGPAGLAAAINATTDGMDTAFIDTQPITGGQSKYSSRVENYPGFPIGISGEKLARNMYLQATMRGADPMLETQVTSMDYDPKTGMKTVHLSDGTTQQARTVIIAGGVQFRHIGDFPGSDAKTIVYGDAKILGRMAKGRTVVVVGGSNGAAQAALGVSTSADHVYVLSRSSIGESMSDYQVEALKNNKKVTIIENDQIDSIDKDQYGNSRLLHTKDGKALPADAVGIFAGSAPQTQWLPKEIARVKAGREKDKIMVNRDFHVIDSKGKEAIPGVYAVGDVRQGSIQRILASAAEGQMAERQATALLTHALGAKKSPLARDVSIEEVKEGKHK